MSDYKIIAEKEHGGLDIIIYEMSTGQYASDIKQKCGEHVWGWEFKPSFNCAMMKAVDFIDLMK